MNKKGFKALTHGEIYRRVPEDVRRDSSANLVLVRLEENRKYFRFPRMTWPGTSP